MKEQTNSTLREMVRKRDGDSCYWCGNRIDFSLTPGIGGGPSLEHVMPIAAGGSNDLSNLRLSHAIPCNQEKGAIHNGIDYGSLRSRQGQAKLGWNRPCDIQCSKEGV